MLVGKSTKRTTTRYTQDLAALLIQMLQSQSSATTDYVYGSERLLTDAGAVGSSLNYDAWGTPQGGATPPTFGYTG